MKNNNVQTAQADFPAMKNRFFLIAGPCVVENEALCMHVAETVIRLAEKHGIPYVFKASYRKANRSRSDSFTGIGDREGLRILHKIRNTYHIPVLTDIHSPDEAILAAEYDIDILQIPAFLCRQTDLLAAAGRTGRMVNVKKGQFVSPEAMRFAVQKVQQAAGRKDMVMLTERGTQFGYHDLVVDFRGIPEMQELDVPVVLDVTHSLQQPNRPGGVTGGRPEMIETIARAGVAVGVDGLFIETHPDPSKALSDGANMLKLSLLDGLLQRLMAIEKVIHQIT
ncbi:MAG: 3-deoxy-8-phosphooctulonate synthase [Prevotellaceae bacterium]|jgi:2-dehydro-3-deoxyphosphooctonate aldolase (KDO 8-P synthase)|nr:3-deoxy-8-phosphooctulonate synthase [Prevotellaceae bacterium]